MTTAGRAWRLVAVFAVLAMAFVPQRPDGTLSMRRATTAAAHMEARTAGVGSLVADGRALTEVTGAARRAPLKTPVLFGAIMLLLVIAAHSRRGVKRVDGCGRRPHASPGAVLLRAPPPAV